jgi:hypothetical protein
MGKKGVQHRLEIEHAAVALTPLVAAFDAGAIMTPWVEQLENVAGAFVLRDVLSEDETKKLCEVARLVHSLDPRKNDSISISRRNSQHHTPLRIPNSALNVLAARIRPYLPNKAGPNHDGPLAPEGSEVSGFLRFYIYEQGDFSNPHFDRSFTTTEDQRLKTFSAYSLLLYLNDDCDGGHTNFFESNEKPLKIKASVKPRRGDALIFPHGRFPGCYPDPYHEGGKVTAGVKLLLRTDIIYLPPATKRQRRKKKKPVE